jgi:hypothetical protein
MCDTEAALTICVHRSRPKYYGTDQEVDVPPEMLEITSDNNQNKPIN